MELNFLYHKHLNQKGSSKDLKEVLLKIWTFKKRRFQILMLKNIWIKHDVLNTQKY